MSALPYEPTGGRAEVAGEETRTEELLGSLAALLHDAGRAAGPPDEPPGDPHSLGRSHKVSVSLPEELTAAVQQRVGKGEFSRYVTHAVAHQLELDLLAELSELLEDEHGPIPEEYLAEAGEAWPDEA